MAKNRFRITESDFLLANRKASREEEIARFGKQIIFRTSTQKSKKVYDRKRLKRTDIKNTDDLPFLFSSALKKKMPASFFISPEKQKSHHLIDSEIFRSLIM